MTLNIPDNFKVFERKYEVSPVEFYRIQLGFTIPGINNTKLTILAYICNFGYKEGRKRIIEDRIVTSNSSLHNYITEMRTQGFLEGYGEDVHLVEDIMLVDSNHVTLLTLIKDESKNEIGHRYYQK